MKKCEQHFITDAAAVNGLWVLLSVVTCFVPLLNSTELMSNSKYSSMRYMMTLQRIHVIGSGMPTTEMAG